MLVVLVERLQQVLGRHLYLILFLIPKLRLTSLLHWESIKIKNKIAYLVSG